MQNNVLITRITESNVNIPKIDKFTKQVRNKYIKEIFILKLNLERSN